MTTPERTDPAWLTVGAEVAVVTTGTIASSVEFVTVERFTKTRVVLSDGMWVNRDDLTWRLPGRAGSETKVMRPDDPRVLRIVTAEEARLRRLAVVKTYDAWHRQRSDTGEEAKARLDALAAAVQAARAALDTTQEAGR